MRTLLQINVTANSGSTGKIAEQINQLAQSLGWNTYFAYGRNMQPCKSTLLRTGNKLQVYEHYAEHRLFDNDGLASRLATHQLVKRIKEISPDIIHLHNIHDHWLNYRILFEFLNTLDIPIVWTQHDCWAFTGGCAYFSLRNCYRWRDGGCKDGCPMKARRIFEKTTKHFQLKQNLFTSTKNLTLVPVSYWLEDLERQSFLNCHNIVTIHNGIDISKFHPTDSSSVRRKYGIGDGKYVIGVASVWSKRKGFDDYIRLSHLIPKEIKIVLVGLNAELLKKAEENDIIGIPRTEDVGELAALYSGAMMFLNLTYEDNYPTTNLEAMACGTPILTYRTGGSVEAVTHDAGWIAAQGDIDAVAKLVEDWAMSIEIVPVIETEMRRKCRERAEREFNKEDRYADYLKLYNALLK